ncbi:unannotated protein [freshwater metagenome]|uniref:Unannotated protein n=1 Tax=freshwater metagenome TaxID=449393 RepID=A0A6J7IYF2_9ZZZZ
MERRHVLILVDDEAAIAFAEFVGHRGVLFERRGGVQQQIVEVEQHAVAAARFEFFVSRVHRSDLGCVHGHVASVARRYARVVLGGDQRAFRPLDLAREVADGVGGGGDAGPVRRLRDHGELTVEQLPPGVADDLWPEIFELAHRGSVEGTSLHRRSLSPDAEFSKTAAHLTGRPRGEGDRQYLAGGHVPRGHEMRDASSDRAGLTRSGPGEHTDRTARGQHCRGLLRIETGSHRVVSHVSIVSVPTDSDVRARRRRDSPRLAEAAVTEQSPAPCC